MIKERYLEGLTTMAATIEANRKKMKRKAAGSQAGAPIQNTKKSAEGVEGVLEVEADSVGNIGASSASPA